MKRLILSVAIILGGLTVVTGQTSKQPSAMNHKTPTAVEAKIESSLNSVGDDETNSFAGDEEGFDEVSISEVPKSITRAIAKGFRGSSLSKAYVNPLGEYKIELSTIDDIQVTAFYNEPK